jgi:hypothetical protein
MTAREASATADPPPAAKDDNQKVKHNGKTKAANIFSILAA